MFHRIILILFVFQAIFEETKKDLEETEAKREKTQRALDCTRTVLHKTEGERAEQVSHFCTFFKLRKNA